MRGRLIRKRICRRERCARSLLRIRRSFEANHGLGEIYFHSGKYREAIPFLNRSLPS